MKLFIGIVASAMCIIAVGTMWPALGQRTEQTIVNVVRCASIAPCISADNNGRGPGVLGTSANGSGVVGRTTSNLACSSCNGDAGVLGEDHAAQRNFNYGVAGVSTNGTGVAGTSTAGTGVFAQSVSGLALSTQGDALISGTLTVSAGCTGCSAHVTRTSAGTSVMAYSPRAAAPTMEDVGEGQLQSGQAFVRLDSAFAATIDKARPYLVFLTPEGDSRGLYVVQKSAAGFTVRENQGGRSSVAFQYRIVAKPYDSNAGRLAPWKNWGHRSTN